MASISFRRLLAGLLLAALVGSSLPGAAPAGAAPAPLAVLPPFALPLLEGPNLKVEIGVQTPSGPATSFIGAQPAHAAFTIWWWDLLAPTQATLVLDGFGVPMSAAPGGDGDLTNGTQYLARVNIASMVAGAHSWRFEFRDSSGALVVYPAVGNLTNRLDRADRFLTDSMITNMRQVRLSYPSAQVPTLRDVVDRVAQSLNSTVGTDWDATEGYTYLDKNHFIIQPVGATATNHEAYVNAQGASRARYTDSVQFPNNSQPAIKQAYLMRGGLLATGLFNESDIEVHTEAMVLNNTSYAHPHLRVQLNDGSELAGDGPADGDGWMDVDLWALGLSSPVALGSHFGEDFDTGDDAPWDGTIGWPPVPDTLTDFVLSAYSNVRNVSAPDGSTVNFYVWDSTVVANTLAPTFFGVYLSDNPILFAAVNSVQSNGVDLSYEWELLPLPNNGFGPVWTESVPAVGNYNATLTVRDPFGSEDSLLIPFQLRGQTRLVQPIPDITIPEDGKHSIDLRVFFGDADGFGTIQFAFAVDPPGMVEVVRFPATSPFINLTVAPDWCGQVAVTVNATDGIPPLVVDAFNVTVACVNDQPVLGVTPPSIYWDEDLTFAMGPMSQYATDGDPGDRLVWSYTGGVQVTAVYNATSDTLVFGAPPDWHGTNTGRLSVSDGTVSQNRSLVAVVNATNDPPVLISAPQLQVAEDAPDQMFDLATYFYDPDGDPLTAMVTPYPGVDAGFSTVLKQIWYHPTADFVGTTSFELRVLDAALAGLNATVTVQVAPVNDAPEVSSTTPPGYISSQEGVKLDFATSVSDPDDVTHVFTFALDGAPQGSSLDGTFTWTPGFEAAGRHTLCVTAADSAGASVDHCWQVQISDANRPPTASILRPSAATFKAGEQISLSAQAADEDGNELTYTWSFGGQLQPMTGPNITFKFNAAGSYTVRLTVNDGIAQTAASTEIVVVYTVPPSCEGNCTCAGNCPPPPPPPTPGLEAAGALAAIGAASLVLIALARRRR